MSWQQVADDAVLAAIIVGVAWAIAFARGRR